MAIKKKVTMPNGLTLEYHRIALLSIDVNSQVTILRHSYIDEEARNYEKRYAMGEIENPVFPYVDAEYLSFEYDSEMNLAKGTAGL